MKWIIRECYEQLYAKCYVAQMKRANSQKTQTTKTDERRNRKQEQICKLYFKTKGKMKIFLDE